MRGELLIRHARHPRAHFDDLSDHARWAAGDPAPAFVVPSVPGDPCLNAALTTDSELLEDPFSRTVILATATIPTASLRTIAFARRQRDPSQGHSYRAASRPRAGPPARRTGNTLDRLRAQLGRAVEAFDYTLASVESRVMVTARTTRAGDSRAGSARDRARGFGASRGELRRHGRVTGSGE
ncbi:DNA recombination protein RmuC [Nocardia sp. R7R-8]|uniref:DNA recombination protein RmuC n=1 Tax=Nocardia sp. R7R-8 TaxID=3459304 RepID=UPI00403DC3C1